MSQELLQLLERYREMATAGELVDVCLGGRIDGALRHRLARMTADGYRAEGKSFADTLAIAKLRVALMDKYGDGWSECPEWKAYEAARVHPTRHTRRGS